MNTAATTKIITRKRAMLTKNKYGRTVAQRIGSTYHEVWYWNGTRWNYKEFDNTTDAKQFLQQYT